MPRYSPCSSSGFVPLDALNGAGGATGSKRFACHNFPMSGADSLPAAGAGGPFLLGVFFGAVGQRVNFCTMGAVSDAATFGDWRRMRMWVLAIVVALRGGARVQAAGRRDRAQSLLS